MARVHLFYITCTLVSVLTIACVFLMQKKHAKFTLSSYLKTTGTDLRILVITYNRASSLKRLLVSLNNVKYYRDSVVVEIWIDRLKNGDLDRETVRVAETFEFLHGITRVYNQSVNVGISGQWITTWQPAEESSEIAVILEDDLTISPYFYKYLKTVHAKYADRNDINGFSLQGVSIKHDGQPGFVKLTQEHPVYLYPTLGTWGFSPNRENWFKFVAWYLQTRLDKSFKPLVPNHIASSWYSQFEVQGRQETFWEIWHIHHAWKNGLLTLYPNCPDNRGFSFNWKENGLHYNGEKVQNKNADNSGLIQTWSTKFDDLPKTPVILNNGGEIIKK